MKNSLYAGYLESGPVAVITFVPNTCVVIANLAAKVPFSVVFSPKILFIFSVPNSISTVSDAA